MHQSWVHASVRSTARYCHFLCGYSSVCDGPHRAAPSPPLPSPHPTLQACRELRDAARVMGNTVLFQQMEAASAAIKRDVIFAASLYVA